MHLYMTYDGRGFDAAVKESDPDPISPENYHNILSQLISWGMHDFTLELCDSFEIYNEQKEIVFEMKREINKGDVA